MKKIYVISAICLLIFVIYTSFNSSMVGVTANNLESDARKSQKIDDSWQVAESVTEDGNVY